MNNPENAPVDTDAARKWLGEHMKAHGLSWRAVGEASGIPKGTLSPWFVGKYQGKVDKVAAQVMRYRQKVESQSTIAAAEVRAGLGAEPGFLDTPTAERLRTLLLLAHGGAITLAATGPGTGKTLAAQQYQGCVSNVWIVTAEPTTTTLAALMSVVMRALEIKAQSGWVRQQSEQIAAFLKGRDGLLIVDEANNLPFECLEQLRTWHDLTGVGICLLGNEELYKTIRGGNGKHNSHAFARLNSRIATSHVQDLPLEGDVAAYLDGWGIDSAEQRTFLTRIALTSGAGGLRELRHIIRPAVMFADEDRTALSLEHLTDAFSTRTTRHLRLAAIPGSLKEKAA